MGVALKVSAADRVERRAVRKAIDVQGGLRELGAIGGEARIHNVSLHGFLVEADELYAVGTYVWLHLPGVGRLNAQIKWRDSFRYGCEFVTPLSPGQYASACAAGEAPDDGESSTPAR